MTYSNDQIELLKFIGNINAKTQAWIDAEPNRWAGMLTCNLAHWAGMGIFTVDQFKRHQLEEDCYYSVAEAFSKSYARSLNTSTMTDEELESLADRASKIIEREAQEAKEQAEAEGKRLDQLASDVGTDRATLDRWMQDATSYEIYG